MKALATGSIGPSSESGDRAPLLRWLIFTGTCVAGFVLAWRFGLVRMMLESDKTHISPVILAIYALATLHCYWRTATVSRELDLARRVRAAIEADPEAVRLVGDRMVARNGDDLPPGVVTEHIHNLAVKARLQGRGKVDQTLLLHSLADRLRGSNGLGNFASDSAMKLGLLGTIVGFIMMLAPIAGLDMADRVSVKSSMGLMSDGMAVAMYTTLTGLIGAILIKTQYYLLEIATGDLFRVATNLTEVYVVSVLERDRDGELR